MSKNWRRYIRCWRTSKYFAVEPEKAEDSANKNENPEPSGAASTTPTPSTSAAPTAASRKSCFTQRTCGEKQ
jgi:hypothetical protein